MANNPNPQEFNRDVDLNKAEDLTNYPKQYKPKESAHKVFPDQVAKADPDNITAEAGPGPASKHLVHVSPEIRDRKNAILMETAGRAALATLKTGDELYRQHINSEIENELDAIAQESVFGQTDLVLPSGATPPELEDADARLDQLTKAYQAGKIRESAYLVRMADAAQKLKQKYGITQGYGQVVDDMIRKHAGFDPANRLREHLISESERARAKAEAAAAKASNLEKDTFERYLTYHREKVPLEIRNNVEAWNNPEKWGEANRMISSRLAEEYDAKTAAEQSRLGTIEAEKAVGAQLVVMSSRIRDMYAQADMSYDDVVAKIQSNNLRIADPNDQLSQKEAEEQAALMSQLKTITNQAAYNALNEMGPNVDSKTRKGFLEAVQNMTDLVAVSMRGKGPSDVAGVAMGIARSQVEQAKNSSQSDAAALTMATKEETEAILTLPGYEALGVQQTEETMRSLIAVKTGQKSFDTAVAESTPRAKGALIQTQIAAIQSEDLTPADRAGRVKKMFAGAPAQTLRGEKTNAEMRSAQSDPQAEFFYRVTTPEFAKSVASTEDPKALEAWLTFMMDQYKYYNETNINQARYSAGNRPQINVKLDPESLMFSVVERTSVEGRRDPVSILNPLRGVEAAWEGVQNARTRSAIEELNRHTQSVSGALKAIGVDPKPQILNWWTGMGWSEDIPYQPSLGGGIGEVIRDTVIEAFKKPEPNDKKE